MFLFDFTEWRRAYAPGVGDQVRALLHPLRPQLTDDQLLVDCSFDVVRLPERRNAGLQEVGWRLGPACLPVVVVFPFGPEQQGVHVVNLPGHGAVLHFLELVDTNEAAGCDTNQGTEERDQVPSAHWALFAGVQSHLPIGDQYPRDCRHVAHGR